MILKSNVYFLEIHSLFLQRIVVVFIMLNLFVPLKASEKSGNTGIILNQITSIYNFDTHFIVPIEINRPMFYSPLNQTQLGLLNDYELNIINWLNQVHIDYIQPKINRGKRFAIASVAVPVLGWLIQKIPDIFNAIELRNLRQEVQGITEVITTIKDVLKIHESMINNLIGDINKLQINFNLFSSQITESLNLITHELDQQKRLLMILYLYHASGSIYQKSELKYFHSLSLCEMGLMDPETIDPDWLRIKLIQLSENISQHNYSLSIPLTGLQWYYKFNLVHCESTPQGLTMLLAIPIKSTIKPIKRFTELIPVLLRLNDNNYKLEIEKTLIVEYSDHVASANSYHTECLGGEEEILDSCLIKIKEITLHSEESCVHKLYYGSSIHDYEKYCKLIPSPSRSPVIQQLNSSTWIYSGDLVNVTVNCLNLFKSSKLNRKTIGGFNSNSLISLECGCSVLDDRSQVLIDGSSSCRGFTATQVLDMYPIPLIPFKEMIIGGPSPFTNFRFSELTNISLSLTQIAHMEPLHSVDNLSLQIKTLQSNQSGPYSSTYYIIGIIITLLLSIIIFLVLSRRWTNAYSLVTLPKLVSAASIENFTELGFDLICWIIILIILFFIWKEIRLINRRLRCHNCSVFGIKSELPHLDLVIHQDNGPFCMAIKQLPLPAINYYNMANQGTVSIHDGTVTVQDFKPLEDIHNNKLSFNGIYFMAKSIELPTTIASARLPNF